MIVKKQSEFSFITRKRELNVTQEELDRYDEGKELLQNVFPQLTPYERDFIKYGVTEAEFKLVYGETNGEEVKEKDEDEELNLWDGAVKSKTTACPECNETSSEEYIETLNSFVDKTNSVLVEDGYEWEELHYCLNCGTMYVIKNGT